MQDIRQLTLEEAERQLKMNLSLIEMLKKNTPVVVIANFRNIWVEPLEVIVKELKPPVQPIQKKGINLEASR